MSRIILYSNDVIGQKMAGPGIRYSQMAKALAKDHQVLLLAPWPSDYQNDLFEFKTYKKIQEVTQVLEKAEVIIAQKLPPRLLKLVRRLGLKYIVDFYDPVVLENLEANREKSLTFQQSVYEFELANQALQLAAADHILVASERQRDFWTGVILDLGRLTPAAYQEDVSLANLFSIVPFGISSQKVQIEKPQAIKELISNYTKEDKVVLWGGGIWNWFDPLSVIKAIAELAKTQPEMKLLFLGTKHPNPDAPEMAMTGKAVKLATDLGLVGKHVFFNYSWVPYAERHNIILACFAAVSTHFDHLETRLSFRTRIVDSYIWAGLPIIATRGDSLAETIEKNDLGIIVDYESSQEIAAALAKMADQPKLYSQYQKNIKRIQKDFYWEEVIKPISKLIKARNWSNLALDNRSFQKLIIRYYLTGFGKVRRSKGLSGIFKKIFRRV